MRIITSKVSLDTDKDMIVLAFHDDNELNAFISKLVATPVRTSGMRVLPMVPPGVIMGPLQEILLDIIEGIDGACGTDEKQNKKIIDDTVGKLDKLLNDE
jgi:hypothetical protein